MTSRELCYHVEAAAQLARELEALLIARMRDHGGVYRLEHYVAALRAIAEATEASNPQCGFADLANKIFDRLCGIHGRDCTFSQTRACNCGALSDDFLQPSAGAA